MSQTGGELNAAIARRCRQIHTEYHGRGPQKARALFRQDVIVVLMEGTLSTADKALLADGKAELVASLRDQFEDTMRAALVSAVEQLTGAHVIAFMSDSHVDPDLLAELFVMDRPVQVDRGLPRTG